MTALDSPFDVIIVGAGPAGAAAALRLASGDLRLARRTVLLDAQTFPREKLCGGGLVAESDRLLRHLGVEGGFASVPIRRIVFEYPGGRAEQRVNQALRVVYRREFDEALVNEARARGVEFRDGDPVRRFERTPDGIGVVTASGACFEGRIVIGADGARSMVRRELVGERRGERFVALEMLTAGHDGTSDALSDTAVFDFRPAESGMRGYAWDFPSLRNGERWMNRGICAATRTSETSLKDVFADTLAARGIPYDARDIQGGIGPPYYDPEVPQSSERVLLAGDAVGIDPWFGEGISMALGTGIVAANVAAEALAANRFGFENYSKRIEDSAVGHVQSRKQRMAELFYPLVRIPGGVGALLNSSRQSSHA